MVPAARRPGLGKDARRRGNRRTGLWLLALALVFFVLGLIKYRMLGR